MLVVTLALAPDQLAVGGLLEAHAGCNDAGKIVITATQMLDSMIRNPRPTRAEASDVANAIYDGTDAIMLSGESASGLYPIEAAETMAKIAQKTESQIDYTKALNERKGEIITKISDAISLAACSTAAELKAAAIITATQSGITARMVSKFRPLRILARISLSILSISVS
nr:pyruvate kinase [Klebsiella pneumoniae]